MCLSVLQYAIALIDCIHQYVEAAVFSASMQAITHGLHVLWDSNKV